MYFWYKFFTYLFFPFSFAYLFLRKLKKKEHPTRYLEKLGKIEIERGENPLIWFHVASVGEAMSILPLIENFERDEKINKILITTITLSSGQILQKRYSQSTKVFHQFLPLDIPNFINKFLNHWNPNLAIFIDSEIWPNLILEIKKSIQQYKHIYSQEEPDKNIRKQIDLMIISSIKDSVFSLRAFIYFLQYKI